MSMALIAEYGVWYVVDNRAGESTIIPADALPADLSERMSVPFSVFAPFVDFSVESFGTYERKTGWCARYSMPGYLDCTDWCGVYETEREALDAAREAFGDEDEEEEDESSGGYTSCACRDCMEIAIGGKDALCHECEEAGCEPHDGDCCVEREEEEQS